MKQKTIGAAFTVQGKGLHTGLHLTAKFLPAEENHGYKIRRIDIEGQPVIDAVAENVKNTTRGTVLVSNKARCSTVEHAFSALYAHGIDNVMIEVDGPEIPILDGSSAPYVESLQKVGIVEQDAEKTFLEVEMPVEVIDEVSGSRLTLLPADDTAVSVTIDFNSHMMPMQSATLGRLSDFDNEISAARTFVFVREIEPLLEQGLIKGGDLDNAIVIYERQTTQENMDMLCKLCNAEHHDASVLGYMQHKPLVWDNEPARHKLLDVIGDLALVGYPVRGHIIAIKPGHTINNLFARRLRSIYNNQILTEFL